MKLRLNSAVPVKHAVNFQAFHILSCCQQQRQMRINPFNWHFVDHASFDALSYCESRLIILVGPWKKSNDLQ